MKRVILFLTFIEVFLLGLSSVWASHIEVCGDVTGVWSADTVNVICDVRVHPESTLSIEPGVLVLFDAYYKFIVDAGAVLRAIGTVDRHITFTERSTGNGWHGIRFNGNYGSSRLEYCDLRHGLAQGSGDDANGGGIYLNASSPTILSCLFDSCRASKGGGVYCMNSSEPEIRDCSFLWNQASLGGAIYCNSSSPTITNNTISNNSRGAAINCTSNSQPIIKHNSVSYNSYSSDTHGIGCANSSPVIDSNSVNNNSGSGIYCIDSSPEITGNQITANSQRGIYLSSSSPRILDNMIAMNENSGIYCYSNANAQITANIIKDNSSIYGGGIYCSFYANAQITANIIKDNSSTYGGGILCYHSNPVITNNIIAGNTAIKGGAIFCNNSSPIIWNSILYFNFSLDSTQIADSNGSAPNITYCDVQGGRFGQGNIDVNPLFRDPLNGDYHLQDSINCGDTGYSPCIDRGNPSIRDTILACYWGLGTIVSDMGAYGGSEAYRSDVEETKADILLTSYSLCQNYPNPFNSSTKIEFALFHAGFVSLNVYNVLGRKVRTLVSEDLSPGYKSVLWDGKDDSGKEVSSGIYFYRIKAHKFTQVKKMVIIK